MNLSELNSGTSNDNLHWKQFLSGDRVAFEKLMTSHFSVLFHYGTKFSKDKEWIKDCIQDLFLQLWERRSNLSEDIAVKPYLMASLRRRMHRTMSHIRLSDDTPESNQHLFEIEFSIEDKFIQTESSHVQSQRIKLLLDSLPKRQKEVIYLKFFQDMDREQIATIMEIAPQTASNLLQMAIKQLKIHWKAEFITLFLLFFFF